MLSVDVEEKATGQLQLSAGYSSLEKFILSASVAQTNFMGKGQEAERRGQLFALLEIDPARLRRALFLRRSILLGGEIYRRDYNSFNYDGNGDRNTTYEQVSTGGGLRLGFPVTEFVSFGTRYSLVQDKVTLGDDVYFRGSRR